MNNIFTGIVKDEDFYTWLNQFDEEDKEIIYKLLPHYQYFTSDNVFELLGKLYSILINEYKIDIKTTLFVPVGYTAKSGNAITYFFRRQNSLNEDSFMSLNDIKEEHLHGVKSVVFIDDFIGSGEYLTKIRDEFICKMNSELKNRINFIGACIVGYEQGIERASSSIMKICVAHKIPSSLQPFHSDSVIFNELEKEKAKSVLLKYNEPLNPKKPFGYGDVQGLLSFFFATPNNTLPIFWSSKNDWYPLFPRGDSRRNPNMLIVLPEFLQEKKIFSSEFNSKIIYSDDITKALFSCFLSLDKMNIMSEVFCHLNIDNKLILEILTAIDSYQNLKHEKTPICTSIFVVDEKCIEQVKKELIADAEDLTIFDKDNFKKHLMLIDGWACTLAIDHKGNVLGILNYPKNTTDMPTLYHSDKYKHIKSTSYIFHGLLLIFTNNDKVFLYYNGDRIMTKKEKNWHTQGKLSNISNIALAHDIVPAVLDKVIELAFKLSDNQEGALLCVGDEKNVVKYTSKMGNLQFSFRDRNILTADEKGLLAIASQDGAVIISSQGEVLDSMVRFESPHHIQVKAEDDKGTRHNTAKKMSAATNAIYITVSSDGPISIYVGGDRILRMMC